MKGTGWFAGSSRMYGAVRDRMMDIDNMFIVDSDLDTYIKDNGPPGQTSSFLRMCGRM
jgi:hypothetical protein